jgi:hypothetical protein
MSEKENVILPNGEFYIFDAQEDKGFEQIYFSSHEHLIDHIKWWLNNRTDGFTVYQQRFTK